MNEKFIKDIDCCCKTLALDFSGAELAHLAASHAFSAESIDAVSQVLCYLQDKKKEATIQMLLKTSRLPQKNIKTFTNFDFSVLRGKDVEKIKALSTLTPVYARKNVAFIGPTGTGKTHLAMSIGHECCQHGLKTYFIKASELRDKFTTARRLGRESAAVTALVRPSCLIIDEIGHCDFDKENTRLFFDMIDRRYNKEGAYNIVFTSNKTPSQWKNNFDEDDALLCSLDRVFDNAIVVNIRGESFRGKGLENIAITAGAGVTVPISGA